MITNNINDKIDEFNKEINQLNIFTYNLVFAIKKLTQTLNLSV